MELPGPLLAISAVLPMTRSISAARAFAAGASWDAAASPLVGDLALGLAWGLAGFVILAVIERIAISRGTLEGV